LSQFQSAALDNKQDMLRLLKSINQASGDEARDENLLGRTFEGLWGQLDEGIKNLPEVPPDSGLERDVPLSTDVGPIVEELLVLVRQQTNMLTSPEMFRPIVTQINEQIQMLTNSVGLALDDAEVLDDLSEKWSKVLEAGTAFYGSVTPDSLNAQREQITALLTSLASLSTPVDFLLERVRRHRISIGDLAAQFAHASLQGKGGLRLGSSASSVFAGAGTFLAEGGLSVSSRTTITPPVQGSTEPIGLAPEGHPKPKE
jgi:hypothetical protein